MGMRLRVFAVCGGLGICVAGAPGAAGDTGKPGFTTARLFIEFNATDRDVGVQVALTGDAWKDLEIHLPGGSEILDVDTDGSLERQGVSEFFFESAEPSLDDVPLDEFLARFPEGRYGFEGETREGRRILGTALLSHAIPEGPEIVAPDVSGSEPPVVNPRGAVIAWRPVTASLDGAAIEIVAYQVTVEQEEPAREFRIDVPASVTRVTVPPEFFAQRGTAHGFEVLAIAANGNQTISAGEFVTPP
jgi:hypothetical protein